MLALDSTIGCIEVGESDVLELYRSAPVTRSSSLNSRPETMEAHLCAIRKKTLVKVFLALVVNDRKIYVYTAPGKGTSEAEYPRDLEEALECARGMGFSPERVDLSYSPAMREVVVRNSKILRLPGNKGTAGLKHGQSGAPTLPMARKSAPKEEPLSTVALHEAPIPPLSPVAPAPPESAAEPAKPRSRAQAEPGKEQQALIAERDALHAQMRQLSLRYQEDAAELSAAREACAGLSADKQTLLLQVRQAEEQLHAKEADLAQALDTAADLASRLDAIAQQHARTEQEHESMLENLALARQDLAKLTKERDEALESEREARGLQRETAAKLEAANQALEQLRTEREDASQRAAALMQEKERLEEGVAELRRDLSKLEAEKGATLQEEQRKSSAETELAELHRELAKVTAEREALQQAAAEAKKGADEAELGELRGEILRLSGEKDEALRQAAALDEQCRCAGTELEDLRRELERVRGELDQARPAGAAHQAEQGAGDNWPYRPHQELAKVQAPLPLPPNPAFAAVPHAFDEFDVPPQEKHDWSAPQPSSGAATDSDVAFPPPGQEETIFLPLGDLAGGGFSSGADDGAPVRFMLETGLTAIEVRGADDVLDLHQSINNAYLSPEGSGGQESCQGYVCGVRNGDAKEVFAAIYGTQSKRTRIYLPEAQPCDDDSYARTVRAAVCFAEEVGLMMEPVLLDASAAKRQERLKRCPALRLST